jgi:acylphosphatase
VSLFNTLIQVFQQAVMCRCRLVLENSVMNAEQDRIRVYLKVSGRVQGVFFRASTAARAQDLGVTGWVRNHHDGTVEVVAEGKRAAVDQLLVWCRQGPPGARVEHLEIEWQLFRDEFRQFSVKR